ncbi:MAG TPA: hypothetical protein VEK82_13370 [Stellaceae bacterium]|nr:hypothetical protein [Stellaceae bacterium]
MFLPFSKWSRLPSRVALLLGLGALSAAGAKADTPDLAKEPMRVPQHSAKTFGELRIWNDDGRIFVSESGREAQELLLGDTAEARHLRQLLARDGAAAESPRILLDRIILVGGGGDGFHWAPADRSKSSGRSEASGTAGFGAVKPSVPVQTAPPENSGIPGKPAASRAEKKG